MQNTTKEPLEMCVVEVQTGACVLSGQQNKIVIHLHRKMKLSSIIRLSRSGWTHALPMAFFCYSCCTGRAIFLPRRSSSLTQLLLVVQFSAINCNRIILLLWKNLIFIVPDLVSKMWVLEQWSGAGKLLFNLCVAIF